MPIWLFRDYKDVIRNQQTLNMKIRGYQRQMAAAMGCQPAFVSQVINTHVHLTPDQAMALAEFFGLNALEGDYFLNLVMLARAATPRYRAYLTEKGSVIAAKLADVATVRSRPTLNGESEIRYYARWFYSAIHILITIPEYRQTDAIARRLNLPRPLVSDALNELKAMGLAAEEDGTYSAINDNIHVGKGSPLLTINHLNWRHVALAALHRADPEALHYSAVYSVSKEDYEAIKELMLSAIANMAKIAAASPATELYGFVLDSFIVR